MTRPDITPPVSEIGWEVTREGLEAVVYKTPAREAAVVKGMQEWYQQLILPPQGYAAREEELARRHRKRQRRWRG